MTRFVANLSFMFNEWEPLERFQKAAEAGFTHVEFLFPYEHDLDDVKRALTDNDLTLVLFDSYPGEFSKGQRGFLGVPGCEDQFEKSIIDALEISRKLGSHLINPLAGKVAPGASVDQAKDVAISNLRRVASSVEDAGVTLCIEGLNTIDNPGYLVDTTELGFEIVDAVNSPAVKYLYDAYHMQVMEGNIISTVTENLNKIGHIQISDVPGRHEPGSGEINYPNVLAAIDQAGYKGLTALEYRPANGTLEGLEWLPRERRANRS